MEVDLTELLSPNQVSELLDCTPATLANKRVDGKGPKFIKICGKIKYRRNDVEEFINSHAVRSNTIKKKSTSQEVAA
jgi:hypothetical protein